jgi:hypothetical protein
MKVAPGDNLDLHATVKQVRSQKQRIALYGPYELHSGLYYKFLMQKAFMESGAVGYQAFDTAGEAARKGNGCDCIHAITDADAMFGRGHYPLRRIGDEASDFIVEQIMERGGYLNPHITHDWLIAALGLEDCVTQMPYEGPSRQRLCEKLHERRQASFPDVGKACDAD